MNCSRVRRELIEHFRFREGLGPVSSPHLAHLESCADCRREVGIDRELVEQLRRALRARVEGSAPSTASWELVRRRIVDRPARPWANGVLRWGGVLPAALAGTMMFAIAIASDSELLNGTQSPGPGTTSAEQAATLGEHATGPQLAAWNGSVGRQAVLELASEPLDEQALEEGTSAGEIPPIPGRMR